VADNVHLKVDGDLIKDARDLRKPDAHHGKALRIFRSGQCEERDWGGTISGGGELRISRARKEDEFQIEVLNGDFKSGCPQPYFTETWPLKHVYIQQTLRHKRLDALIACCNGASWYHHDIRIIGDSEIVYDCHGRGFRGDVQLWIQTRGKIVAVGNSWRQPPQRVKWVDPDVLGKLG
jgi:hypothetical protein